MRATSPASPHATARIISWAVILLLFLIVLLAWGLAAVSLPHTSGPGGLQTPFILLSVIVGGLALFSGILIWRIQAVSSSYSRAVALFRESRERYRFLAEAPLPSASSVSPSTEHVLPTSVDIDKASSGISQAH
ncbi:MAG: hypothetical protein K6360_03250 [Deltaproteobacteria bacterium]